MKAMAVCFPPVSRGLLRIASTDVPRGREETIIAAPEFPSSFKGTSHLPQQEQYLKEWVEAGVCMRRKLQGRELKSEQGRPFRLAVLTTSIVCPTWGSRRSIRVLSTHPGLQRRIENWRLPLASDSGTNA